MAGGALLNTNLSTTSNLNNRYAKTSTVYVDDKTLVYDLFVKPVIDTSNADIYHTVEVQQQDRLDILAQIYYGDPSLWWMIAVANNMIDPFVLVPGTTVRIPSISTYYLNAL